MTKSGARSLICAALFLLVGPATAQSHPGADRAARAILFSPAGFPTVDAPEISADLLARSVSGLPGVTATSIGELQNHLDGGGPDVLVLAHGSAFPIDAWSAIRTFLERGGGLVVLGGAPFHQPVHLTAEGRWELGTRQPTFARELLIGPAEPVRVDPALRVALPDDGWTHPIDGAEIVWELIVRMGTRPDLPDEHGSEAYRDAVLRPLVHLVDGEELPRACPLLEIDHLLGGKAGARWILAPSDAPLDPSVIRAIVQRALQGASEVDAGPVYASIQPDEAPVIRIAVRRPALRQGEMPASRAELVVRNDAGLEIGRQTVDLSGVPSSGHQLAQLDTGPLTAGLYHVDVVIPGVEWEPASVTTGFWVRDDDLLRSGPRITVSKDWIRRDGRPLPVIGTTYMASDVHRKFLFEPDPHVWDRDFRQMADLGINFVRTGLWTGWSRAMLDPGEVDEAFLRALDAYLQTAAKHDIVVNFTFFGFLPPAYGGTNPYLDRRSIEGQQEFLAAVASRYRGVGWIHYDLINEPSYAPPEGLWTNRPIRDRWERDAWHAWVSRKHGDDLDQLRDRWQIPGDDILELPRGDELRYTMIRENRSPRKARDFVLFTNDVVAGWAARLRDILRIAGGDVLVTLGQDEGGTWFRPSQQLHAHAIDYTAVHPWWQNDDLLATGVVARVPEKPMLFQETGLMRLEDIDGWPWRSPERAAQLLERKYAYAFAARGSGVIEWAWNINPYMAIDNESVIGFFRPDGTVKPEIRVVPELARFFETAVPYLDDFEPPEVIVVIPHSRLFANRPAATDGFRRLIRVLGERFGIVPAAISELTLTSERLASARLVIVPSLELIEKSAARALVDASRTGTRILVTGAIIGDPHGEIPPALQALGVVDQGRPVMLHELTRWSGETEAGLVTFDRNLQESLRRSLAPPLESFEGTIWHEPLPLEHARQDEALVKLLEASLTAARVEHHPAGRGVVASVLHAPRAVLVVAINETSQDAIRQVVIERRTLEIPVKAGRSRMVLLERATGAVIAETAGEPCRKAPR